MENNVVELNQNQESKIESTASANSMILNPIVMKQIDMIAGMMAEGKATVPNHLKGSKSDCFAIVLQAAQWGMNPFAVAQKTHLVNGTLGYEAQLVNAVVSSSNVIEGRFKYEHEGDWTSTQKGSTARIRVGAVISGENQTTWGEWLFIGDVTTRNSPLWKTAPKQQASYLAVKYWARIFCPEVILGVYSHDELDRQPEKEINPHIDIDKSTGEIVNEITVEDILLKIESSKSMADLKNLTDDIQRLGESDIKTVRNKWTAKQKQLKGEFEKTNINPEQKLISADEAIKLCQTTEELTELLKSMSEGDQLNHYDLIAETYDSFR